jgi:hypothetical protein
MNISNSTPHPFYLETKLFVFDPNNYCISNSIGFAYLPIAKAYINTKYESNIPINKTDGDSLTYHLTSCKENGLDIPQYFIPNDIIINEHTGQITWLQPSQLGQWSFAIIVKKWRKNILVGTSLLDYTIEVISAPYTLQNITVNTNCILNADSTYTCNINPTDTMQILLTDSNCNIILYTEIDTINNYTFQNDTAIFKWNPTIINARHNPYKLTFRHYKLLPILAQYKDITFFITVNETTQNSCITPPNLSEINPISENETLSIYPNPSTNQLYINAPNKSNISISNILGEQILIAHNIIQNSAIDISTLPTGIYNITIQTNTKTTDTKFIKQ